MTTTENNIFWDATELSETLSVYDQIYIAEGTDEQGNKYIASAIVSCGEIVEITDIEKV